MTDAQSAEPEARAQRNAVRALQYILSRPLVHVAARGPRSPESDESRDGGVGRLSYSIHATVYVVGTR